MNLPEPVIEHLRFDYMQNARPFCFQVDRDCMLLDTWGDARWCGMEDLITGTNMLEKAPYLFGSDTSQPQKLQYVATENGAIMHLHVIPQTDSSYVVLLDAGHEHRARQQRQQSMNELRLLQISQQRLIRRQRDLISELVEAKAELDHHRREAERDNTAKGRFIATMSHEFRTPLASIINYSDLALEENIGRNEVRKCLEAIGRSGRHLTSLVEAVLDDARIDAGHFELRERDFDLYDLVSDLSAIMAPLAAEKELSYSASIEPDVPHRMRADDVCLRQILVNLLGNAVKFTEEGGIRLALTFNNGRLLATITDTGIGIAADDQERVFQAFERGDHAGESGAGLGLTISLRLARLMGGEVSLDSNPGRGCTVGVLVPMVASESAPAEDERAFAAPSTDNLATRAVSILVCDDDEDMLALAEFYLHRAGYGLIACSNGDEAIEKALAYRPDLVLMDVNVPGINGIDAARHLREQGYGRPIIALTASSLSEEEAATFTLCFRKPAPMQNLLSQIKRLTHES